MPGRIIALTQNGREKKVIKVSRLYFFIGRDIFCDVRIIKKDVSPQHCLITALKDNPALIRNLSRKNPTLVNEKDIGSEDVELKHDDIISINRDRYIWRYDSEDGVVGETVELARNRSWSFYKKKLGDVTPLRREKAENGVHPAAKKKRKTWPAGDEVTETQPGSLHKKLTRVIGMKGGVRSARTPEKKGQSSGQRKSGVLSSLKGKVGTPDIGGRKSVKFADTTPTNRSSKMRPLQRSALKNCTSSLTPYRGPKQTPSKKESVYFTPPSRSGGGGTARLPQDQLSTPPEVSIGTARKSISTSGRKSHTAQVMRSHRKCTPAGGAAAATPSTPKSTSKVPLKRRSEFSSIEASRRAAKKLKAEPPHAIDEKKKAAILMCHRKSLTPHPGVTIRKPLFRQVLKKNLSASFKKLKSPKQSASPSVASPIVLTTVVPKQFNFQPKDQDDGREQSRSVSPKKSLPSHQFSSTDRSMRRRSESGRVLRATAANWRRSEETTAQRGDHVDLLSALDLSRKTPSASVSPNSDTTVTDGIRQLFASDKTWDAKGVRELFLEADNNTLAEEAATADEYSSELVEGNIANKSRRSSVLKGKRRTSSAAAEQSKDQCDSILTKSINSFYMEGQEPSPLPEDSAALNSLQSTTATSRTSLTLQARDVPINDFVTSTPLRTRSDLPLSKLLSTTKKKSISVSENSIESSFRSADSTVATLRSGRSLIVPSNRSVSFPLVSRKSKSSPKCAENKQPSFSAEEWGDTTSSLHLSAFDKSTDTTPKPKGRPSKQRRSSSAPNMKDIENMSLNKTRISMKSGRGSAVVFNKSVSFTENPNEGGVSRKSRNSQKLAENVDTSSSPKDKSVSLHLSAVGNVTPKSRGRPSKKTEHSSDSNIANDSSFLVGSANGGRSGPGSTKTIDKSASFVQVSNNESQGDVSRKSPMSAKKLGFLSSLDSSHFTSTEDAVDTKPRGRPSKQRRSSSAPNIKDIEDISLNKTRTSLKNGRGSTVVFNKSVSFVENSNDSLGGVSRKSRSSQKLGEKTGTFSSPNNTSVSLHLSAVENVTPKPRGRPSKQNRSSSASNVGKASSFLVDSARSSVKSGRGSTIVLDKSASFDQVSNKASQDSVSRKSPMSAKRLDSLSSLESSHFTSTEDFADIPKARGRSSKQNRLSGLLSVTEVVSQLPSFVDSTRISLKSGRETTAEVSKNLSLLDVSQNKSLKLTEKAMKSPENASVSLLHLSAKKKGKGSPKPPKERRSCSTPNIVEVVNDMSALVDSIRPSSRRGRSSALLNKCVSFAEKSTEGSSRDSSSVSRKSLKSIENAELENTSLSLHLSVIEKATDTPKSSKKTIRSSFITPGIKDVAKESTKASLRSSRVLAVPKASMHFATVSNVDSLGDTPLKSGNSFNATRKTEISLTPEYSSLSLHLSAIDTPERRGRLSKRSTSLSVPSDKDVITESSFVNSTRTSSRGQGSMVEASSKYTSGISEKLQKSSGKSDVSLSPGNTSWSLHLSTLLTPKPRGRPSKERTSLSEPNIKDAVNESFRRILRSSRGSTVAIKRSTSFVEDSLPGKINYTEMESITTPLYRNSDQIYSSTPIVENKPSMRPQGRSGTPDRLQNSLKFSLSSAKPRGRPSKVLRSVSIPNIEEVSNENISANSLKRTSFNSSKLLVKISPERTDGLPVVLSPVITVMSEAEVLPENVSFSNDNFRTPRTRGREKRSTSAPTNRRKSTKFGSHESCSNVNTSRKSVKKMAKENRSVSFSSFHLVIGENGNGGVSVQQLTRSKQKDTRIGKPALSSTPYPTRKRKLSKCTEISSPWENKRQRKEQFRSLADAQISETSSGMSTPELLNSSPVIALSPRKKSLRLKVEHESESLIFSVHGGSSPLSILSPNGRPSLRHKMEPGSGAECDISNISIANCKNPTVSLSRLPDDFLSTSRRSIKALLERCSTSNLGTSSANVTPRSEKVQQISFLTQRKAETSFTVQEKDSSLSEEINSSTLFSKTPISASSRIHFSKSRLSKSTSPRLTKSVAKESSENLSTSKGKLSKPSSECNKKTLKSVATSSKSNSTISPQMFFGISSLQARNNIENDVFKTPNSDASSHRLYSTSMNRRSRSFASAKTPMTGNNETSKSIVNHSKSPMSKTSTSSKSSALSNSKIAVVGDSETTNTSLTFRSRLSENKFLPKSLTLEGNTIASRDPEVASAEETPKASMASRGRPSKSRVSENRYKSLTRVTTPTAASETPKIFLASDASSKSVLRNRRSKSFTSVNLSPRLSSTSKNVSLSPVETKKSTTKVNVNKRKLVENGSFSISPPVKKKKNDVFVSKFESVSVVTEAQANDSSPARKIVENIGDTAQEKRARRGRSENKAVTADDIEGASSVKSTGRRNKQVSDVRTVVKLKTEKPIKKTRGKTNQIDSTVELTKLSLLTSKVKEVVSESAGRSTKVKDESGIYKGQEESVKPQTKAKRQDLEAKEEASVRKTRGRKAQAEQSKEESEKSLGRMKGRNVSKDIRQKNKSSEDEDDHKEIVVKTIADKLSMKRAGRRQGEAVAEPSSRRTRSKKDEVEADVVTVEVEDNSVMSLPKNVRKLKGSNESGLSLARANRSRAVKEITLKEQKANAEPSSKNAQSGQTLEKPTARRGRNQVDVSVEQKEMEEEPNSRRKGRSKKVEESIKELIQRKVEIVESSPLKKTRGRKKKEAVELVTEELPSKTGRQKRDESSSKEVERPRVQRTRNGKVEKVKDQVSPKISPLKKTRGKRVMKNETMELVQTEKVGRTKKTEDTKKAVEPTKSMEKPAARSGRQKKVDEKYVKEIAGRKANETEITDPVPTKKTRGRKNMVSEEEELSSGNRRRKVEPSIQEVERSPVQKKKTGKMELAKVESPKMSPLKSTRGRKNNTLLEKKELPSRGGRRKVEESRVESVPVQRTKKEKLEVTKDEVSSIMSPLKRTRGRKNDTLLEKKELPSRGGRRKVEESRVESVPVQRTKKGRVAKVKESMSPQQVKTRSRKTGKEEKTSEGRQSQPKRKSILSVKMERTKTVAKRIKARLSVRRSSIASLAETKRKRVDFNMKKKESMKLTRKQCK